MIGDFKKFSHRLLLLRQRVHPALPSTVRTLARPKAQNQSINLILEILLNFFFSIHLLLMEKSLESLDPPAASESMEELPSPTKVLLPSSSQGGRIGEVWDEYDKGTIAIWLI